MRGSANTRGPASQRLRGTQPCLWRLRLCMPGPPWAMVLKAPMGAGRRCAAGKITTLPFHKAPAAGGAGFLAPRQGLQNRGAHRGRTGSAARMPQQQLFSPGSPITSSPDTRRTSGSLQKRLFSKSYAKSDVIVSPSPAIFGPDASYYGDGVGDGVGCGVGDSVGDGVGNGVGAAVTGVHV